MSILLPPVVLLLVLLAPSPSRATAAPTHLFLSRAGSCAGAHLPVSVSELSIVRRFYDFILTGNLNITVNLTNGWDVKAVMQKCPDLRNTDTCDHYRSFTMVRGGCMEENVPGFHFYSMFFHFVQPKLNCPIRAGQYRIENYPFYTEDNYLAVAEVKISTSVFGYTVRLHGFSGSEQVMCVEAYLRLLYTRDHNWLDLEADADATEPPADEDSE